MKPWLCKAGQQLREQFDDTFPDRDRRSDGWIADAGHVAAGTSDHIPHPITAVVRGLDIDKDLHRSGKPDIMPDLANQLRLYAKSGKGNISYIIYAGKIASPRMGWRFRKYRGVNPHNSHLHVSFNSKGDLDSSFFNIPLLGGTS